MFTYRWEKEFLIPQQGEDICEKHAIPSRKKNVSGITITHY